MPDVVVRDLLAGLVRPEPEKPEKDDGTEKAILALSKALQAAIKGLGKDIAAAAPGPAQAPVAPRERPRRWVFKAWREKDGSMTIVAEAQEPQKEII
jgi:hypothetical protein